MKTIAALGRYCETADMYGYMYCKNAQGFKFSKLKKKIAPQCNDDVGRHRPLATSTTLTICMYLDL